MRTIRTIIFTIVVLAALAACESSATPAPTSIAPPPASPAATSAATSAPVVTPPPAATATTAPVILKPGNLFPAGLTNEPLSVVTTSPADKSDEAPVTSDKSRVIIQFNHPVVALVSVDAQKTLPQPLTFQPAIEGTGQWLNTSTYVFTPAKDLSAATAYSVSVKSMTDMLGQTLSGYAFSFKTVAPSIAKMTPDNNTVFAGPTQPITVTFNTPMDTASVESRFRLLPPAGGGVTGKGIGGKFDWTGPIMRFTPDQPLDFNTQYAVQLTAGAQDVNKVAATKADINWNFRTIVKPDLASSTPRSGDTSNKDIRQGMVLTFTSPMDHDALKVTIVPTIANQSIFWDFNRNDTVARIGGNWLASETYKVTISGQSKGRYGDVLGKDIVVSFTAAPLDPSLALNTPGNVGMYDANGSQVIYASYTNIDRVDFSLYRVDRADFISLIGRDAFQRWQNYRPPAANKIRDWSLPVSAPLNAYRVVSTTVTASGLLAPGVYYLEATSPTVRGTPSKHLIVTTPYNVALKRTETEALVWVTDLKSGKPVSGQPIALLGPTGNSLGSGTTNTDGVYRATFARVQTFDPVYAISESDGRVVAAVGSDWNNGINTFDYNLTPQYQEQEFYANLYTDRAIYRPGQSVFFRGILRRDNDVAYSVPTDLKNVPITVNDGEGRSISNQSLTLDAYGAFSGEVKLSDAAGTGAYNITLQLGTQQRPFYAGVQFLVAEYKAPDYQVTVKSDKTDYVNGDSIKLDVNSAYFFGGAVSGAKVQWRLLTDDLFFQAPNVKGYWDWIDSDLLADRKRVGGVVSEGKGTTDAQGNFHADVPANLGDFPLSQNFTLDAEITDINNEAVSNRVTVPVHKGQYYIGLRPQRYLGTTGQEQSVDVLTVDPKGQPVGSQKLTVSTYQREWYNVREKREDGNFYWTVHYSDTLLSKMDVTTDAQGAGVAKFTPNAGGTYRIVAEGTDSKGNKIRSATYEWVAGTGFVSWRQDNSDRFDLIADKKQYAPGETADILIPAPFAGAEALLTIERGTVREVRHLTLAGNSEKVQVPIRSDYAPNVYVSVMLFKGRASATEPAQFKMGYVSLDVTTGEKTLAVKLTADKPQYSPGDKATFTIEATDSSGKPVAAEFSLALVDKAVQSLADDTSTSPLAAFYGRRGLSIMTASTLVRSVERLNQTVAAGGKGGGGGGGAAEAPSVVRRNFQDTAYWKADVTTDASGKAQVSVALPDNLTTWNLRAKGVSADTKVGDVNIDVISTKDLLLRPVTPRFFVVGDKVRIEAVANNNTSNDINATVGIEAQGLSVSGNATQTVAIKAKSASKVGWDTVVKPEDKVVVKFSTTSSTTSAGQALQDAVEYTLPIERQIAAETVATAGEVTTKIAEQIKLPANADKTAGTLQIELSPSLAAASKDGLKYLESSEYDSSEQTVSRFFPNIATYLALKSLGIDRPELKMALDTSVGREMQRLYALQNGDGGWGWWRGDDSRPQLTAYALLALNLAKQAGYTVDANTLTRAEQFLVKYLEQPVDAKVGYAYNERAFVIYVLTEMGRNYTSRAVTLYDQRANLGAYGKAYLLLAMQKLKLAQAQTLQTELTGAAVVSATGSHWEEARQDYWTMNTNTRSTAVAIMAMSRGDPKNATLSGAVRWLMSARIGGHWATTQDTAWAVLALTEYMQATKEAAGSYTYSVQVNSKPVGVTVKVEPANVDQPQSLTVSMKDLLLNAANELLIARGDGDGKLYYSANLQYYLPTDSLLALNKGIVIGRQYYAVEQATLKPTDTAIASAKVGDYVQVKLVIVAPTDLNYLAVEDPLPAGFEAVDTTLKTSSAAVQSPKLDPQTPAIPVGLERWFRPYYAYWANTSVRDDKVAVFATTLGRGTYEYTYMIRASVAGEYITLPARAWETYFPDVMGRSEGAKFQILP